MEIDETFLNLEGIIGEIEGTLIIFMEKGELKVNRVPIWVKKTKVNKEQWV